MPRAWHRPRPPAAKARPGHRCAPARSEPSCHTGSRVFPHRGALMPWLARGRPTPTPPLTPDALVAQALATLAPPLTTLTPLLPPAVLAQTFLPVLHRLVACGWDLPAATPPHDRPWGLLTQSLAGAQQALTAFTQARLWWAKVPE